MRKIQHKQIFRLWFEFYRLCLLSEDKEIKSSVKKTLDFYEPWNLNQLSQSDLNNIKFDNWWKTHHHIFGEDEKVELLTSIQSMDDDHLYFSVPKRRPLDLIKEEFDNLLRKELDGRSKRQSIPLQRFSPTEKQGNKYDSLYLKLDLQKNVFQDKSLKGEKLVKRVQEYIGNERYVKKENKIPSQFILDTKSGNYDSVLRNCNRYRQKCRDILLNVSNGEFPGNY